MAVSMAKLMAISMVVPIAGAIALSMTCLPSTTHADFVYVPPDPAVVDAAHGSGSDIGSTSAGPTGVRTVEDGAGKWKSGTIAPPLQLPVTTASGRSVDTRDGAARPAVHDTGLWHVRADETLREVLGRWGARKGIEVLFLTDRRYRLHEGRAFRGSFEEASEALFTALSHLPHPPVGEVRTDGRTLAVMHRSSPDRAQVHRARPPGAEQ